MDAGSLAPLQRLIATGRRSLLQYASDSSPFATAKTRETLTRILAAAAEEREAIARVGRFLQKLHVRPNLVGSYPAHFTQLNFITVDFLVPKLIAENEQQLAEMDKSLASVTDPAAHELAHAFVEMKRRHLHMLKESVAAAPSAA